MNSQILATATIASTVGAKYDILNRDRPGNARFTSSAMQIASAMDAGIVPNANHALFFNACQKMGSWTMAA